MVQGETIRNYLMFVVIGGAGCQIQPPAFLKVDVVKLFATLMVTGLQKWPLFPNLPCETLVVQERLEGDPNNLGRPIRRCLSFDCADWFGQEF